MNAGLVISPRRGHGAAYGQAMKNLHGLRGSGHEARCMPGSPAGVGLEKCTLYVVRGELPRSVITFGDRFKVFYHNCKLCGTV
jgi:hypothetical protein